jgi:antitoxin component of MazEF toxin-antitoxin module
MTKKSSASSTPGKRAARNLRRLEDLVKRITPRNIYHEFDFGGPVGREAL